MDNDIKNAVNYIKSQISGMSSDDRTEHHNSQKISYDKEYKLFSESYDKGVCYLCNKSFLTISKNNPCLHWLLRRCKFKKKHFKSLYEKYDYYELSAFLHWVSAKEKGSKNINNLKEEMSERKKFEITIKWKNIEWTLDCSHNDFIGHGGSQTDFPHWHFQMRIDGKQFINFNDFHIPLSKDDQLKIMLSEDKESGFCHSFGYGGFGMQETMDALKDNFDIMNEHLLAGDAENGTVHMQSIITTTDGSKIDAEVINDARAMSQKTDKTMRYCLDKILKDNKNISRTTIASPSEHVPDIAKRTERKRR
jgi:hypothetical protein